MGAQVWHMSCLYSCDMFLWARRKPGDEMMMKSRLLPLVFIALTVSVMGTASAANITLTQTQIDAFTFSFAKSSSNVTSGSNNMGGFFDVNFDSTSPGAGLGVFELTGLSIAYTAGDVFSLLFTNNNFSTWDFEVFVTTDGGSFSSGVTSIVPGTSASLGATLASGSTITAIEIRVSGTIPNTNNPPGNPDVAADWRVQAVPEPGSLLLMGSGLAALSLLARRRSR